MTRPVEITLLAAALVLGDGIGSREESPLSQAWEYGVAMRAVARHGTGRPGVVLHIGDSFTYSNPYRQWARVGALVAAGRDHVLAVKDNQHDLHEAGRTAPASADEPAVRVREKNAGRWRPGGSGTTRRRPTTPPRR